MTLDWSNLVFLVLLFQVYRYCLHIPFTFKLSRQYLHYRYLAVSTRKSKLGAVVTSASCGAILLLSVGAMFAYRNHYVNKIKHDVFVDVAGNFCLWLFDLRVVLYITVCSNGIIIPHQLYLFTFYCQPSPSQYLVKYA